MWNLKSFILIVIVFMAPLVPAQASGPLGDLQRLQELLNKTSEDSPFRSRLLARIENLKGQDQKCSTLMAGETDINDNHLDDLSSHGEDSHFPPMEIFPLLFPDIFPSNFSVYRRADLDLIVPRLARHPEQAVETFMTTPEEIGCHLWGCDARGIDQLDQYQKSLPIKLGIYLRPRRIIYGKEVKELENAIVPYLLSKDSKVQERALRVLCRLNLPLWNLMNQYVLPLTNSSNDLVRGAAHVVLFLAAKTLKTPADIPAPLRQTLNLFAPQ